MIDYTSQISHFLMGKKLSLNSQKSYQYDLEQFCQQVGRKIDDHSLRLYQESLMSLKATAQKRKESSVNQFLYFLYEQGVLDHFYKLKPVKRPVVKEQTESVLELESLYQETQYPLGQLIALLILELGLTPSQIAALKTAQIDKNFQVLTVKTSRTVRILPLSDRLLPYLKWQENQVYLFERLGAPYSRQWFFTQLTAFVTSCGLPDLTAQKLRQQFILRECQKGTTIVSLAKKLGLKKTATLEKYYKDGH